MVTACTGGQVDSSFNAPRMTGASSDASADVTVPTEPGFCCNGSVDPCCEYLHCGGGLTPECIAELDAASPDAPAGDSPSDSPGLSDTAPPLDSGPDGPYCGNWCCNANPDPCCGYAWYGETPSPQCNAVIQGCTADGGTYNRVGYTQPDGSIVRGGCSLAYACPDPTADAEPPDGGAPNGSIFIEECTDFCLSQSPYVSASFFTEAHNGPPGSGLDGCAVTTSGACTYYSCTGSDQPGVRAGTIEVSGVWPTPTTVDLRCDTNSYEYAASSPGFAAGQTLTVSASGANVPAFGPQGVVAPPLALLTSPAFDAGMTSVSTSADLPIAWTGGQAGATMLLKVASNTSPSTFSYTSCSWDASAGQGTIPAVVLKPFSGTNQQMSYGQYRSTAFSSGAYSISLSAMQYTGGIVSFQ